MNNKRTILLIAATLVTLVLAVIAVVTSLKLRELATVSVAPNVPQSQPKAAFDECGELPICPAGTQCVNDVCVTTCTTATTCPAGQQCVAGTCQESTSSEYLCRATFTVAALSCGATGCAVDADCAAGYVCATSGIAKVCAKQECTGQTDPCNCTGAISCLSKKAFEDVATNKADSYEYTKEITADTAVQRNQQFVYQINYKNTKAAALTGVTVTDVLPETLTFVDSDKRCILGTDKKTVTCTIGNVAGNATGTTAIRVKVKDSAAAGKFTNQADVKGGTETSSCSLALKVEIPSTPAAPKCNDYCANDGDCPSDLKCSWNKCRNPQYPDETDCSVEKQPGCNESCETNTNCAGGYTCDTTTKTCRNSACVSQTSCVCPTGSGTPRPTGTPQPTTTPTATPEPEQLPEAGTTLPTIVLIGVGGILAILGIVLAGL